jgi:hypothetical protein
MHFALSQPIAPTAAKRLLVRLRRPPQNLGECAARPCWKTSSAATFSAALAIAISFTITAVGQAPVGDGSTTEQDQRARLIDGAKRARDANASRLQSAYATGKVRHTIEDGGPVTTLIDADVQVFYDAPKFRVHLVYDQLLTEQFRNSKSNDENFEKWKPSSKAEQLIVYNGSHLIAVTTERDGTCSGTIYFGFSKMTVLRNAGFPFEDPVQLWTQALSLEGLDQRALSITELQRGGFVGLMQKNRYRMKFFVCDNFGYDLRRVSSYRTGELHPFRDYLLDWSRSQDVYYVTRFSNSWSSANPDTGAAHGVVRSLSVEYSEFQANLAIAPEVFTLSSMSIPNGTKFIDKRSKVENGPRELVFNDGQLTDTTSGKAYNLQSQSVGG